MAISEAEYQLLREKATKLRREAEKAEGSLETLKQRLIEEYGLKTLDEALKKIDELTETVQSAEETYQQKLKQFEEEWGERLNSVR